MGNGAMMHYRQDCRFSWGPTLSDSPHVSRYCQRHSVSRSKMHRRRCGGACKDDMRRAAAVMARTVLRDVKPFMILHGV